MAMFNLIGFQLTCITWTDLLWILLWCLWQSLVFSFLFPGLLLSCRLCFIQTSKRIPFGQIVMVTVFSFRRQNYQKEWNEVAPARSFGILCWIFLQRSKKWNIYPLAKTWSSSKRRLLLSLSICVISMQFFFTVVLEDLVSWLQRIFFWVLLSDLFDRHEDPGCTAFSSSWELEQKTHLQPMLFEVPNQAKPEDPHRTCARVRSLPLSWVPQIFLNLFHIEPTHWKPPQKSHSCALPDLL